MDEFKPILQTDRLHLVHFTEAHVDDFAAMNGDAADDFDHPHLAAGHWLCRHVPNHKRRNS
ncbi:MAG TPA: hypothetical protein DCS39_05730 [Rhodobiaceae bacterium]|nr:hypothetical protein [Rhodobiaceae bacterium]